MQKVILFVVLPLLGGLASIVSCSSEQAAPARQAEAAISQDSLIKRGAYLVTTMVCDDCHSPKRLGPNGPEIIPERRLSGFDQNNKLPEIDKSDIRKGWIWFYEDLTAAVGPWGASFARNLTSDSTGIGAWTEEQFKKAIRHGKYKGLDGSRTLLPPMPWTNFRHASDADLKAIFTFLKSTRPVKNVVPEPIPLDKL